MLAYAFVAQTPAVDEAMISGIEQAGIEQAPNFQPLYRQIRLLILKRLAKNTWRPGEMLPSETKLAQQFRVSQGTVRKALDELAGQNLVVRQQGKGTFVAQHTPHRALFHFFHLVGDDGSRKLPESRLISCASGRAEPRERECLALSSRAHVVRIRRVRSLDATPVIVESICVPAAQFQGLTDASPAELPNTLYAFYEQRFQVVIAHAVERLKAVSANAEEVRLLKLPRGAPLLEIERIALGHEHNPIEWRRSRCHTDNCHYLNELD